MKIPVKLIRFPKEQQVFFRLSLWFWFNLFFFLLLLLLLCGEFLCLSIDKFSFFNLFLLVWHFFSLTWSARRIRFDVIDCIFFSTIAYMYKYVYHLLFSITIINAKKCYVLYRIYSNCYCCCGCFSFCSSISLLSFVHVINCNVDVLCMLFCRVYEYNAGCLLFNHWEMGNIILECSSDSFYFNPQIKKK